MSGAEVAPAPQPDVGAIHKHLELLVRSARGAFDDALVEIAWSDTDGPIRHGRLFELGEMEQAAAFAAERNRERRNLYVGATLKLPETQRRGRTGAADFYVATLVSIDIDEQFEAVRARVRGVGKASASVITGTRPATRAQAWFELTEPCTSASEFDRGQQALVQHVGSDLHATGVARLMRLGGTVAYPSVEKQARGYEVELTTLGEHLGGKPVDIARLHALAPMEDRAACDEAGHVRRGLDFGPDRYGEAVLEGEAARVSTAPRGTRNATLNRAAFCCGQMVAAGRLAAEHVKSRLSEAAEECGLVADGGVQSVCATIESGLRGGAAKPRSAAYGRPSQTEEEPIEYRSAEFVELAEEMLYPPGLVGEVVDFVVASARRPQRMLALLAALATLGAVMGRKYAGPTGSGTMLYACGLAPTGAGKDHGPEVMKILLHRAGLGGLVGPQEFMSLTAVYRRLSQQPQLVCFMDEFGAYLARLFGARASGHEWGIKNVLRTIWGRCWGTLEPPGHAEEKGLKPIKNPVLSIFGTSTPEEFYRALRVGDIFNGFLNRFLIGRTLAQPLDVNPTADRLQPPEQLVHALARLEHRGRGLAASLSDDLTPIVRVTWADGAEDIYSAFLGECRVDQENAELLSRAPETAVRIATIIAVGRNVDEHKPSISAEDMMWARDLVQWSATQMIEDAQAFMAETDNQARTLEVLRVIREAGQLTRSSLTRKLQHKFNAHALDGVLQGLEDAGQIDVITSQPTAGRRAVTYVFRG